jgi:hypothetical protein
LFCTITASWLANPRAFLLPAEQSKVQPPNNLLSANAEFVVRGNYQLVILPVSILDKNSISWALFVRTSFYRRLASSPDKVTHLPAHSQYVQATLPVVSCGSVVLCSGNY